MNKPKCRACWHLGKRKELDTGWIAFDCLHPASTASKDGPLVVDGEYYANDCHHECPLKTDK